MAKGTDHEIKKLEKGPLQRFKNQNLILKKYGETGLRIYRAITGKRTVNELRKDLDIKKDLFDEVISYLQEAEMIELTPVGKEKEKKKEPEEVPEEAEEVPEEEETEGEQVEEEQEEPAEEMEIEEEPEEEIEPVEEEIKPIGIEFEEKEEKPKRKKKVEEPEEEIEIEEEPEEAPEEEIEPVEEEEEEIEPIGEEPEQETVEEELPEEEAPEEEPEEFEGIEEEMPEEGKEEEEGLTPIEKIIKNKYGDIGLQVYNLIDGQKTAEEIMNETGLSESKLIEILDFMDEQGIIKLDYPKSKEKAAPPPISEEKKKAEAEAFGPMLGENASPEMVTIPMPVEIPVKSPVDIVRSVQFKTKLILKFKDKGSKLFESIDGKKDVIELSLKLDTPLYRIYEMLEFMMESDMIIMKPITRNEVKKKYGDDGYTVYKRYGREGLMLYELIGKDLTIKQMAEKVTKDYLKVIDMFLFIHEVLGIELPIDRDVLARQLGI